MSAPYLGLELRLDQLLELHRPRAKGTMMSNDKLQAQLDKALAVLDAQRKPVRYIVRPAKPRRGGKPRAPRGWDIFPGATAKGGSAWFAGGPQPGDTALGPFASCTAAVAAARGVESKVRRLVGEAPLRRGGKLRATLPTTRGTSWRYCENCGMKRPGVKVVDGRHLCTRCRGPLKPDKQRRCATCGAATYFSPDGDYCGTCREYVCVRPPAMRGGKGRSAKPRLVAGYVYEAHHLTDWRTAPDDVWETKMASPELWRPRPRFVGQRTIDGATVNVFRSGRAYYYAQTVASGGRGGKARSLTTGHDPVCYCGHGIRDHYRGGHCVECTTCPRYRPAGGKPRAKRGAGRSGWLVQASFRGGRGGFTWRTLADKNSEQAALDAVAVYEDLGFNVRVTHAGATIYPTGLKR